MSGKRKSETTISAAYEGKKAKKDFQNSESDTDVQNLDIDTHEDQSSKSDTEDNNNCAECIVKTNKIQKLEIANDEAKSKMEALKESNTKYRISRQDWAIQNENIKKLIKNQKELSKTEDDTLEKSLESDTDGENLGSDDEDENSENYSGDENNCLGCAEKINEIQSLKIENEETECRFEDVEDDYYNWRFGDKSGTYFLDPEAYNECDECDVKNSKIQALEIANDEAQNKLETEVASAKKTLEESKAKAKVELEKVENQLENEVALKESFKESLSRYQNLKQVFEGKGENSGSDYEDQSESDTDDKDNCVECDEKNSKIRAIEIECADAKCKLEAKEELNAKFRKLRDDWAVKVYQANPSNEDLDKLLSLEPEELFEKYENLMKFNESKMIKVEEIDYAMKDKKLNLQILQRELYEKELDGIMDVLKMPAGDRIYTNILPMIKNLLEQVDTNHYTKAVENLVNE